MAYKPRAVARQHNGRINLFRILPFPKLFMSKSGHFWSTARVGLRQRKVTKFKGFLMLRVSCNGHAGNWLADSLSMLARVWDKRVHWDGTQIVEGWTFAVCDTEGVGPAAKVVDDAPR